LFMLLFDAGERLRDATFSGTPVPGQTVCPFLQGSVLRRTSTCGTPLRCRCEWMMRPATRAGTVPIRTMRALERAVFARSDGTMTAMNKLLSSFLFPRMRHGLRAYFPANGDSGIPSAIVGRQQSSCGLRRGQHIPSRRVPCTLNRSPSRPLRFR
jgi:hypothetical protein